MRRIETAAQMVEDPDWDEANDAIDTARLVIEYARGSDDLIPDWVPKVGRLDDAIVVDAAWPRLVGEIESYLDFCRLRSLEAGARARHRVSTGPTGNSYAAKKRCWPRINVTSANTAISRIRQRCSGSTDVHA